MTQDENPSAGYPAPKARSEGDSHEAEVYRLREIVVRAQSIISTSTYPNWHADARATLAKETDNV